MIVPHQQLGILLSGQEDDDIVDYFIENAFPPEAHTWEVLGALERARDGLSTPMLEAHVNLSKGKIDKVLKILAVETPSPVDKQGSRWYRTHVRYVPDRDKIDRLTCIRRNEQAQMSAYLHNQSCLMNFLRQELDDPAAKPCGRCAACLDQPLLPKMYSQPLAQEAIQFLQRENPTIEPRLQWPKGALSIYNWGGRIQEDLQAEEGRALCLWGDPGWGDLVKQGKQCQGRFADDLVLATIELVRQRWRPNPAPTWVTCVPSLNHTVLVPDFASRVAAGLKLPFKPCLRKIRPTRPQKEMQNSYQQAKNLDGAFDVDSWSGLRGPVLLIDDMVDSRWTFTVLAALLRSAGSGHVFPVALANTSNRDNW